MLALSAQELGPNVYRPWSIDVSTWGPRRKLSKQRKFHLSGLVVKSTVTTSLWDMPYRSIGDECSNSRFCDLLWSSRPASGPSKAGQNVKFRHVSTPTSPMVLQCFCNKAQETYLRGPQHVWQRKRLKQCDSPPWRVVVCDAWWNYGRKCWQGTLNHQQAHLLIGSSSYILYLYIYNNYIR